MFNSKAQPVYDILDKISMPSGDEIFFPRVAKGSKLPSEFVDYKKKGFVAGLDHPQSVLLGQEITKQTGERYTLLPLQVSYDKAHSNKIFKKRMTDYWIWDSELILNDGSIMPDPAVKDFGGELAYDGKIINAEIYENDVFATLINAGLLRKPEHAVYRGSIYFENGFASVWSYWYSGGGRFSADAVGPSSGDGRGVAAFAKIDEKAYEKKPNVRQIDEDVLQELVEKARKYNALMTDLKKHM